MKLWWKNALISLLLCIVIPIAFIFTCLFALDIYNNLAPAKTLLEKKEYSTIESLHKEYAEAKLNLGSDEIKISEEIAFYVNLDDRYFVFTESYVAYPDGTIADRPNRLLVYTVRLIGDKYVLESQNRSGSNPLVNDFYLASDYLSLKQADQLCYIEPIKRGDFKTVGFMYKDADDERNFYFDGVRMEELEVVDPITDEPFILCYAQSDKTVYHSFLWGSVLPQDRRHNITEQ